MRNLLIALLVLGLVSPSEAQHLQGHTYLGVMGAIDSNTSRPFRVFNAMNDGTVVEIRRITVARNNTTAPGSPATTLSVVQIATSNLTCSGGNTLKVDSISPDIQTAGPAPAIEVGGGILCTGTVGATIANCVSPDGPADVVNNPFDCWAAKKGQGTGYILRTGEGLGVLCIFACTSTAGGGGTANPNIRVTIEFIVR